MFVKQPFPAAETSRAPFSDATGGEPLLGTVAPLPRRVPCDRRSEAAVALSWPADRAARRGDHGDGDAPMIRARPATVADAAAIAAVYNAGISDGVTNFGHRPRSVDEIRAWLDGDRPVVVAVDEGVVLAVAAVAPGPSRPSDSGIADFAVYVAPAAHDRGAGRVALRALVAEARDAGYWKLLSGVLSDNVAGRRMLAAAGFREVGVYERRGCLGGAARDVVIVEIGTGIARPPRESDG